MSELQNFIILSHSSFEILEIGFYGPLRRIHFVIRNETTLAEAYSREKNKWMVIYGQGAHLVTWPTVNAVTLSKGPVQLLATQPKDFAFQVSFILRVFTFKWIFFPILRLIHCQGFRLFVSLLYV